MNEAPDIPAWIADFLLSAKEYGEVRLDYMPLWIADFLADDNVEVMSTEQRGAYLMLLMRGWHQQPPASLPNDEIRLAKWAGVSASRWAKLREEVMKPFDSGADGRFYQKRACREWLASARNYMSRKRGADIANEKRRADAQRTLSGRSADAGETVSVRTTQPNPTQPNPENQDNPTQITVTAVPGRVEVAGGDGSGLGRAGRQLLRTVKVDPVGNPQVLEIQSLLAGVQMNSETQKEFFGRRDLTPDRIRAEIDDIRRTGGAENVAAVLTSRLRKL